jgi:ABC-type multidrug transport system fused ATPase/permease subunit
LVALLAVLLFGNIGLQLINPQIMRRFIDAALAGQDLEGLTTMALSFIGVALLQQIISVTATYVSENVGWTATNQLRYDLARHCLYLDMSFLNRHTPGEMIERIDGDVEILSAFFSQFVLQLLGNGILLVGVLVLLFREHVYVGLALTVFVVVTLLVLNRVRHVVVPYWKAARESSAGYFGFLEERLAGTEEIRASGTKPYVMRRFFELVRAWWQKTVRARLMGILARRVSWLLFTVGTSVSLILGANLYATGLLTIGAVYLIFHYATMLSHPMERISEEFERLQQAGASIARIQELLQTESKLERKPSQAILPAGPLAVTFDGVSFAYASTDEEREFVLHDLSFELEPGRVLGLLGRTGSGKTTLARLLFRLYDPGAGCVLVGHTDVKEVALDDLRRRVGMVTQNVQLFQATVRDNLTFFDQAVPDSELMDVIHQLGLTRWYESLDDGLDTVLAAGGGLSAGEAQLLALTRIFLKAPGLVVLDEASSRLDPGTEQLIEHAIDRLTEDRTAIIVAHRLATVHRADEIMILEGGHIQEHGPREQLASEPSSRFYQLLQTGLEEVLA